MTRPKNGCLKILACAGGGSDPSAGSDGDADDHVDENKAISDKSRWSFRRRSTRHRVLKNSDISEPETLSSSKAKAEIAPSNIYSSAYSYASEKPLHQEKQDEKILHQEKPGENILQQEKPDEKILQQEEPDEKSLQQEKPDEKVLQQDKPNEKPLHEEKPDEKLIEEPIEQPNGEPIEKPADQITERSIEQPAEKTPEVSIQEPAEVIAEAPIVKPIDEDVEEHTEKTDESITIFISSTEVKQKETVSLFDRSSDHQEDHAEAAAAVIQSGDRSCTEEQELPNNKDLVMLQAVIRGHLVRRQAAESLQCLLAIVKMQGLVRARQAQHGRKFQDTSSKKLLHNGFALQLTNNLSTSKSIHIKCDPSEPDAAWKWMERWSSMIPPNTEGHLLEDRENSKLVDEKIDDAQHEEKTLPLDSDLSFPKLVPDDVKETLRPSESCSLEASACIPDRNSEMEIDDVPEPELIEKFNEDVEKLTCPKTENVVEQPLAVTVEQPTQIATSREPTLPEKPESSYEDTMDAYKIEQTLEMEGKRFTARKSCNPSFAAAQLKFEELTSNSTVSGSNSLDGASKSKVHTPRSQDNASPKQNSYTSIPESSVGHDPKIVLAASECGTEISISSTLDSPDRSEADGGEIVLEIGSLEDRNHVAEKDTSVMHSEVNTSGGGVQPEKEEEQTDNTAIPVVAVDPVPDERPHLGQEKPDLHDELEKSVGSYVKSPEGTPMSETTFAESHGTPSSEISVNTKKSKSKRPKCHVSKRSLTSPSSDSVGRSSTDNLSKDYRLGRRESSGKVKSDHVDQEPRMSNSTPLPSYMQFTESARAKTSASISPKLSPDVQDNNPRKKHSLPMTNGKQDSSPRMQRSSSQAQAQQNMKSNGAPHNSSDRRWHI